jgi:DNA (cytosine-5)-methyltransferase 1
MTVGSLFAGIGGFDLGLERAGMEIKFQVEIDPFCRAVLAKHWPHVRRYEDVRTVTGIDGVSFGSAVPGRETRDHCGNAESGQQHAPSTLATVDLICGGFPCQDISNEGHKAGIRGERSGLWWEMSRIVRQLRPRYVVVENVSVLLDRGFGDVLGELAGMGYDAEWGVFRACAFGASHMRARLFIVAYPEGSRLTARRILGRTSQGSAESHDCDPVAVWPRPDESGICGVANGIPDRSHRMHGLGNAIVPQIAEWIGRRILEAEQARER